MRRVVVAITGATGAVYGLECLRALRDVEDVETHLIISPWGRRTLAHETGWSVADVEALADEVHPPMNQASTLSSGSFRVEGMIVAPCSAKTLASIASGYADNLISRAADVVLKERRRLVLLFRETPLSAIHLRNMQQVHDAGATVFPPVPAFYHRPETLEEVVQQTVVRVLDQLDIELAYGRRWNGRMTGLQSSGDDGTRSPRSRVGEET